MSNFETAKAGLIENINTMAKDAIDKLNSINSEDDLKQAASKVEDGDLKGVVGGLDASWNKGNNWGVKGLVRPGGDIPAGAGDAWYASQNIKILEANNRQLTDNCNHLRLGEYDQIDGNLIPYHVAEK